MKLSGSGKELWTTVGKYLDCGAGFELKGLGLPVLQIHLQDVGQEEQRVPLRTNQQTGQSVVIVQTG